MTTPIKPFPGEENTWPYVYTRDGTYRFMSDSRGKNAVFIRIDSSDGFDYTRDEKGKFVRLK